MRTLATALTLIIATGCTSDTHSHGVEGDHTHASLPSALISVTGDQRCITSNGIPGHETGPWREGAVVLPQEHNFCVDATPEITGAITRNARISGITVTGIPLRPGTAEYYDASADKGYSRDTSSGWNVEGIGGLIMDAQNAHVDGAGYYHYHGIPSAVVGSLESTLFGYAADGFEIHYVGDRAQSSWQLKTGERESGPGGEYDGTYVQDYQFVSGSGTLDECNGGLLDGRFVYYATDAFPFFPRCFKGSVSDDFIGGRGDRPQQGEGAPSDERPPRPERG